GGRIHADIVAANIPTVGKQVFVVHTGHGKFPYRNAKLFTHCFYGLVHIVYRGLRTAYSKELFGTSRDNYFVLWSIGKAYHVSYNIAPGTRTSTQHHGIVGLLIYLIYQLCLRLLAHITILIKVLAVKRYEFVKNTAVEHQLYTWRAWPRLEAKRAL